MSAMKGEVEKVGGSSAFADYLKLVYKLYKPQIQYILDTWTNEAARDEKKALKRKRLDTSGHTTPTVEDLPTGDTGDRAGRSNADKIAQAKVSKWYDGSCVLSGATLVDGAHIIDVRASGMNALYFWEMLRMFWPLKSTYKLDIKGQEVRNILPLNPGVHKFWDRHRFAVRPVEHPIDPEHRIYLQVV
ncbi:hypothetical protein B0T26DRAFT_702787 [Lasiosphaeria miniovina]|uniref:HNH nuclease domain-containing protein n=1 Tax=Lasiosphaeria miniovina TaxID=1954250 RepID=A0AA40E2E0_9PEZI|nr:uncharacterized protein B0T26DRAFT_702787 [Lasiosphaeria miniovina]KAK0722467.1 hypothetical protein B0T26DRAFT_702787 [Lasiosphaeria miniovina]